MSWRRDIVLLAVALALVASAVVLNACGGSAEPGGDRAQAVASWLMGHDCQKVSRTDASDAASDPDYGLFLERSKSAVLVACDKGPEDSALVWEFDDYDTMSRSLHVRAEQIRGGPYCRLTHVAFTIGNVKDGVGLCRSMLGNLVCGIECGRRTPEFVSQRGWTKADPRTIARGPCGSTPTKPARLTGSAGSVSATEVILISPVDRRGCLRPNIDIQTRNGGGCDGGPSTYRCAWANLLSYDCWATVFDSPEPTAAVCMSSPWSPEALRVDLAPGGPPNIRLGNRPHPNLRLPWGVELMDGNRCEASSHYDIYRGPDKRFKGRHIAYGCEKGGCSLMSGVDKSAAIWTIDRTCGLDVRSSVIRPIGIRTAWFEA